MTEAEQKTKPPGYLEHRARVKQEYRAGGLEGWPDYRVLELALFYAVPRPDTKPAAKELLTRFKTLAGVLNADPEEVKKVEGVGDGIATFLRLLRDLTVRCAQEALAGRDLLGSPEAVHTYLKIYYRGKGDEEFRALFLDTRNRLIAAETVHEGTVNRSVIYPRKLVARGLELRAAGVIIAHNHPGGSLSPSEDDLRTTEAVRAALKPVELALLDHLIVAGDEYFSFREHHL